MTNARLRFYTIDRCGFYVPRETSPRFGDPSALLKNLYSWAISTRKTVRETATFSSASEAVYLIDLSIDSVTGDAVLVTWNETAQVGGPIESVGGNQTTGSVAVTRTGIPAGGIPGYPSYFWFIPSKSILATLQFSGNRNGHPGLRTYLENFMAKFSRFVRREDPTDVESPIVGYSAIKTDAPNTDVIARFDSSAAYQPGDIPYIRSNRDKIKKIFRRDTLHANTPNDLTVFQTLMQQFVPGKKQDIPYDIKVSYEMAYTPPEEVLSEIIDEWLYHPDRKWDDVGFQMENESGKVYWLSAARIVEDITIAPPPNQGQTYPAEKLLLELANRRQEFINYLLPDGTSATDGTAP